MIPAQGHPLPTLPQSSRKRLRRLDAERDDWRETLTISLFLFSVLPRHSHRLSYAATCLLLSRCVSRGYGTPTIVTCHVVINASSLVTEALD